MGRFENGRGVIGKPFLGLLTLWRNLDFSDFGSKLIHFCHFLTLDTALHSQTLQYRHDVASRMANHYTRIFDAG